MKSAQSCRCCLSKSCYKDMSNEYHYNGQIEVYSNMLKDTFGIQVPCKQTQNLICEDCILQIRSASAFKKQVTHAQEALDIGALDCDSTKTTISDDFLDHVTGPYDDSDSDDRHTNDDFERHEIKSETTKNKHKKDRSKMRQSEKNNLSETQTQVVEEDYDTFRTKKKVFKIKDEPLKREEKLKSTSQSQIDMKENSILLIRNSNLCLFDSLKTKYRCFYCKDSFLEITDLRNHSIIHNRDTDFAACIRRLRGMSYKCIDISNLACKICGTSLTDLKDLQNHLTSFHNLKFFGAENFFVPYRLQDGFHCVLCKEEFNNFYRLSVHMNQHFTNNVCETCGLSYVNRLSLRSHVNSVHREKKCSKCPATFSNNYSRVKHMRRTHNTKCSIRYCLLCDKTFRYTYMLVEHRIKEHGAKRKISECEECGKTFLTEQNLKIHVRSVHIRERNHACAVCGMGFFTKCDQRRHESTHLDVRSFACSYCEGRFKSKDSLRRHLKRQHGHLFVSGQ